jgi:hypothetical protein
MKELGPFVLWEACFQMWEPSLTAPLAAFVNKKEEKLIVKQTYFPSLSGTSSVIWQWTTLTMCLRLKEL